ncbi:hypothetical protein J6A31_07370 [bacterium]|nr:hypothetical protein [bacterium]
MAKTNDYTESTVKESQPSYFQLHIDEYDVDENEAKFDKSASKSAKKTIDNNRSGKVDGKFETKAKRFVLSCVKVGAGGTLLMSSVKWKAKEGKLDRYKEELREMNEELKKLKTNEKSSPGDVFAEAYAKVMAEEKQKKAEKLEKTISRHNKFQRELGRAIGVVFNSMRRMSYNLAQKEQTGILAGEIEGASTQNIPGVANSRFEDAKKVLPDSVTNASESESEAESVEVGGTEYGS